MGHYRRLNRHQNTAKKAVFHLALIKPTRYDDQGYSVHWYGSPMPSNSLACLLALANQCVHDSVLGPEVDICVTPMDELTGAVDAHAIVREIQRDGGNALILMVGIQSNQYPRAVDLARIFRGADIPVCIGGFHVTGVYSMFSQPTPEINEAISLGVSLFLGEAEDGRLANVVRDVYQNNLQPVYDFRNNLPGLEGEPVPLMPAEIVKRSTISMTSMDLGRGCPFDCSFCCIINVQGKKSRYRSPEDLKKILLENHKNGIYRYFITDDNFARNRNWKQLLDLMIEVQQEEGFTLKLNMQVDMACHKVPGFIDKAADAGAELVFCGLENISNINLGLMNKPQNKISEYKKMLLAWKKRNVLTVGGYIIGLPSDTRVSVLHDIDTIKEELPIDMLYFSIATPLPGSVDHKRLHDAGTWMDPDLNKYDLCNAVTDHPQMSIADLNSLHREAYQHFHTDEHMETVMRRTAALGGNRKVTLALRFKFYGTVMLAHDVISLDAGFIRIKDRLSRRPGFAKENWLIFYAKYLKSAISSIVSIQWEVRRAIKVTRRIWKEVRANGYHDRAIDE